MPNYDALYARARQCLANGDKQNALQTLIKCSRHKRYRLDCLKLIANIYGESGMFDKAEDALRKAVKISPQDAELWNYLGKTLIFGEQDVIEALDAFDRSISLDSRYAEPWSSAGCIYKDRGQTEKAIEYFHQAIELNPVDVIARINLAQSYRYQGDYKKSLVEYESALQAAPDNPDVLSGMASLHFYIGDVVQAVEVIRDCARRFPDQPAVAAAYAEICKRTDHADEVVGYVNATLGKAKMTSIQKRDLMFTLARLQDQLERYDDAYRSMMLANDMMSAGIDKEEYISRLKNLSALALLPIESYASAEQYADITPVFILGFPRSGSTLVEHILSCHPDISIGGEITTLYSSLDTGYIGAVAPENGAIDQSLLAEIAARYHSELSQISEGRRYVTDKLPGNYERLGLINSIFPHARVINTNRNWLDIAISCLQQNFGTKHLYTTDKSLLREMVSHYTHIMEYWKQHSQIEVYETSYEKLVTDAKGEIGRILDYIGLPWSESCLRHHESSHVAKTASFDQVRQPLYDSSINRWKHYEAHIQDLIGSLPETSAGYR